MKNMNFFWVVITELKKPYHRFPTMSGALLRIKKTTTILNNIVLIVPNNIISLNVFELVSSKKRRGSKRRALKSWVVLLSGES